MAGRLRTGGISDVGRIGFLGTRRRWLPILLVVQLLVLGPGTGAKADSVAAAVSATVTEDAQFFPADAEAQDGFGHSMAFDGNTAVIGTFRDSSTGTKLGVAYVYIQEESGWIQQAQLVASGGEPVDFFGWSVDVSGDTAVVGAWGVDVDRGSAYVFERAGGVWTQQAQLFASDGEENNEFGTSVSIDGDTILVGAPGDDTPTGDTSGSAYVFVRSGGLWQEQAHLLPTGPFDKLFGWSVTVEDDTALIGMPNQPSTSARATYVFTRAGSIWTQQARLVPVGNLANQYFGESVALSDDTAVIGAPWTPQTITFGPGSAYVFVRSGTSWTEQTRLFPSDQQRRPFGISVALSGDTAVVTDIGDDSTAAVLGAGFVFTRSGSSWTEQSQLVAFDGMVRDFFGSSVALSGETILIGASNDTTAAGIDRAGSVYTFGLSGEPTTYWCVDGSVVTINDGSTPTGTYVAGPFNTHDEAAADPGCVPPPTSYKYVALGDSFSAGEGIEPFFEPPRTNRCHRSKLAYPRLVELPGSPNTIYDLAQDPAANVEWGFQACSTATTVNVLYEGVPNGDPLAQLDLDRSLDTGNANDLPVDSGTDLVTITIGGNDLRFLDVLKFCSRSGNCTTALFEGQTLDQFLRDARDALSPQLDLVYQTINEQAPGAQILVLGYPQLFPLLAEEQNCFKLRVTGFSRTEQNYLRQAVSEANQLIAARVQETGVATFVPVDAVFAGHEVCGNSGEWINGPTLTPRFRTIINDQSFHPNVIGQQAYADVINDLINPGF